MKTWKDIFQDYTDFKFFQYISQNSIQFKKFGL